MSHRCLLNAWSSGNKTRGGNNNQETVSINNNSNGSRGQRDRNTTTESTRRKTNRKQKYIHTITMNSKYGTIKSSIGG